MVTGQSLPPRPSTTPSPGHHDPTPHRLTLNPPTEAAWRPVRTHPVSSWLCGLQVFLAVRLRAVGCLPVAVGIRPWECTAVLQLQVRLWRGFRNQRGTGQGRGQAVRGRQTPEGADTRSQGLAQGLCLRAGSPGRPGPGAPRGGHSELPDADSGTHSKGTRFHMTGSQRLAHRWSGRGAPVLTSSVLQDSETDAPEKARLARFRYF